MSLAIEHGWLTGERVARCVSPNADARPTSEVISLLVIHNISLPPGEFGGAYVQSLFTNTLDCTAHPYFAALAGLRVSAHLFIDRAGAITQFVNFDARAWHAGVSCFAGRERCNDFSIGIELEGTDDTPYTGVQYRRLSEVSRCLLQAYPALAIGNIVGHADIAPGRKTDPGSAFDWTTYRRLLTDTQTA